MKENININELIKLSEPQFVIDKFLQNLIYHLTERFDKESVYIFAEQNPPYGLWLNYSAERLQSQISEFKSHLEDVFNEHKASTLPKLRKQLISPIDKYLDWFANSGIVDNGNISTDPFVFTKAWCDIIQSEVIKYFPELEPKQPQQPETDTSNDGKKGLHNHIFKGNAFEIWQSMFDSFQVTKADRTDLRFMYEVMKYNKQIHDIVTVKNITDWINKVYEFEIDKLHYTAIKSKSNNKRMEIYNLIK